MRYIALIWVIMLNIIVFQSCNIEYRRGTRSVGNLLGILLTIVFTLIADYEIFFKLFFK